MWKSAIVIGDCFLNKCCSEVGKGGQEGYSVTVCGSQMLTGVVP